MYNYVQPVVASIIAVWWAMDSFNVLKVIAIVLIFSGVFLVTRSRSSEQLEAFKKQAGETNENSNPHTQ